MDTKNTQNEQKENNNGDPKFKTYDERIQHEFETKLLLQHAVQCSQVLQLLQYRLISIDDLKDQVLTSIKVLEKEITKQNKN